MKPKRWKEIEKLHNAALEHDPAQRPAFLVEACAGDESLRAEVELLLSYGERADSFIDASAMEVVARELAARSFPSQHGRPDGDESLLEDEDRKPRRGAPWWMYAAAFAVLCCAGVPYYAYYIEPEFPGLTLITHTSLNPKVVQYLHGKSYLHYVPGVKDSEGEGTLIQAVQNDSSAARAGLKAGDIILNSGGFFRSSKPSASGDPWFWKAGRTYRMEIRRGNETRTVFMTLDRTPWSYWLTGAMRNGLAIALLSASYMILSLVICFARPYDHAAGLGALLLASISVILAYGIYIPMGWLSSVHGLPRIIAWSTALVNILRGFSPWIGIAFAAVFPRRLFLRRWHWILLVIPAMIVAPLILFAPLTAAGYFAFRPWYPVWYEILGNVLTTVAHVAVWLVLLLNYLVIRDLNERRRVRIVVAGLLVSLIANLPMVVGLGWSDFARRLFGGIPENVAFVLTCLGAMFPISMTYAILRHRLFDIRVMIRQGLRYAAARGLLISLVPFCVALLAGDLLLHRRLPLEAILAQRGWVYVVLAGIGFLLHNHRRVWLDALDRSFFRDQYDAQRVLRAVIEEVRSARSFERLAPRVVAQIEAALHPVFAALMARQPGEGKFRVLAACGNEPPSILADSKLMALARVLGKPVEISQSQTGWLRRQLPREENEFLLRARLEWLYPICLSGAGTEALLALGPKRSEEPYSREDQELLQGITGSLALSLEESPLSAAARAGFEECPQCGTCYDTGSGSCTKEGAKLTPLPFPRLLDRRYRFEQRLGEGGMGTVYRALDVELERQVAVKLIRSDLTASAEATARFRQEAKAAASFTHPNVVTVHDFGVAEDQRAYLLMELLRGSTLRQELKRLGRLPTERALAILSGVCSAVDAAHRARLLHRDLKPENIFLVQAEGAELPKILDFGVVKPLAPSDTTQSVGRTGPGMLLGTLRYMSPEQLRGEKPTESWDLWALAVIAYEMLAGAHPFAAASALEMHNAVLAGQATPLCKHLPEAPPGWQLFFDLALAPRIESRPKSALQLFSDFKQSTELREFRGKRGGE